MTMKLNKILLGVFCSTLLIAGTAFALSLDEAKSKGLVGETQTGYLGAVSTTSEVQALINDINQKRKEKYAEIAKKNGTPLSAVEALAAKKAMQETAAGNYIQSASGAWVKK